MRNKVYCRDFAKGTLIAKPAVARHAFGAIIAAIVIIALMVACNKRPTAVSAFSIEPTGAVDADGNVIPESEYIYTNTIYITNVVTNNRVVTNVITNTLTTPVKVPPPKATDRYYVYVPFADTRGNYFYVYYNNPEGAKELWLQQINGGGTGRKLNIRNRSNHKDFYQYKSEKDYYYFNNNGDIVYAGTDNYGKTDRIIKKFVGAVITKGNLGYYTVGGLYALALTRDDYSNSYTNGSHARDGVIDFIMARRRKTIYHKDGISYTKYTEQRLFQQGYLEALVLDNSISASSYQEFGIISKYPYFRFPTSSTGVIGGVNIDTQEKVNFMTNYTLYIGERPEYSDTLFKESINFSVDRWQNHNSVWWFTFAQNY